jgi:hypothetical protein|tara:strand:+ start:71 stop:280 length:210 start_codon:yes stop_codon:yes gene_type:complete
MKNLLQFQHQHIPEYVIGLEEDIRIAVIKDEVDLWQKRVGDNPDHIPYLAYIRDTLKSRIEELENCGNQ